MTRPVLALAAAMLLSGAAPAAAQERGTTELTFSSAASESLAKQGVRLSARRPATLRRRVLSLPVERGTLAPRVALEHLGGLTLRRGRRSVRLGGMRFDLRSLRATSGTRTFSFMTALGGRRTVERSNGTATLSGARLTLTRRAAALVRRRLKVRTVPRLLGTIATAAALRGGEATPGGGATPPGSAGGPGGSGGPGGPGGGGSGDGGGSGGTASPGSAPSNEPLGDEPPVRTRPAGAVGLSDVRIVWHPRESFIRYLSTSALAPSRGTIVSQGASEGPATWGDDGRQPPLEYDFGYAPRAAQSWTDPGTGATALYFGGSLRFRHVEHGIDLEAKDAEIELDGPASRAIFRFEGRESTPAQNKRAVLLDLDPERVTPTVSGATTTYERIPARTAEGTEKTVFGGFYEPGSEFGWVTVSYSR